jgi:hypothetical protein
LETRADRQQGSRLGLLLLLGVVLLIRLPFLTQAVQGDDVYYLFGAQHALIDPAHPNHARYLFHGELVDMRGHPHPPLNSWMLAGLLWIFGDVYEVPFHAAYILFSLIAAVSMWSLARRWTQRPLLACLLFIAVPAFVVNGNSFEADVPFLAWWLAGIALFTGGRLVWASLALTLAAMTAYQAVVATPILWVWCWLHARRSRAAWLAALTPVVVVGAYQIYERVTSGALPATVLAGYFSTYGLQQLANKLKNAAALTAHTGWLVFPAAAIAAFRGRWPVLAVAAFAGAWIDPHPLFWISFATGALVIAGCARKPDFLTAWVLLFFAAALILFFAGASRYLLPMAAPVALLVARELNARWLGAAAGANLALSLCLAWVNWQHWDGYRQFVRSLPFDSRTWVNGELGLRFYAESAGALPLSLHEPLQTGDWVLTSELAFPLPLTAPLSPVQEREIRPTLPLRLLGLGAKSGYSTAAFGLRPFDITSTPVDRVRAEVVRRRNPTLSWLPMNAPEAGEHILSGIYQLEERTRWMSGRAIVAVAQPERPSPVEVQIFLPPMAPARKLRVYVDGALVHEEPLPAPNLYTIRTPPVRGTTIAVEVDKTFRVAGDGRDLGAVLVALGYRI